MDAKHFLLVVLIVILAFAGGFMFSNSLNRSEIARMGGELEAARSAAKSQTGDRSDLNLTTEEIDAKIVEADANPRNFNFQKSLGLALYRYGAMKQDPSVIEKAIKLLDRANGMDGNDSDVLVALGNSYFDIGYIRKENQPLIRARDYYERALKARPGDVELRTDVALSYYLQEPPELEMAATEFERSLALDPKHEKTLQFYAQTLVKQGKTVKAGEVLDRLRSVHPQNPFLGEIQNLIGSSPTVK